MSGDVSGGYEDSGTGIRGKASKRKCIGYMQIGLGRFSGRDVFDILCYFVSQLQETSVAVALASSSNQFPDVSYSGKFRRKGDIIFLPIAMLQTSPKFETQTPSFTLIIAAI